MNEVCVGLFGTCGSSNWRDTFIQKYEQLNINYFNPQLPEGTWHPGCVVDENKHLHEDDIILFPITSETTGQGSLAEIGFSLLASLKRNPDRYFVFMIDDHCTAKDVHGQQINESVRSRSLVKSKLILLAKENSGIFIVNDLDDMLSLSLHLHALVNEFKNINIKFNNY